MTAAILGTILGTLVGCVPAAFDYVISHGGGDAQGGMLILLLLIINAPLGMIAGCIGGIMYGAKKRFWTAALPCLGVVAGGIFSVMFPWGPWSLILLGLAPVAGMLGVFVFLAVFPSSPSSD